MTPRKRKALTETGLATPRDILEHLPRRYLDRTRIGKVGHVQEGDEAVLDVRLTSVRLSHGRRERLVATARDATGAIELLWFGGARWLSRKLEAGMRLLVSGTVGRFRGFQIVHPEFEILQDGEEAKGSVIPVYRLSQALREAKIDHRALQQLALASLALCPQEEILPECLRSGNAMPRAQRLLRIHRPESLAQSETLLLHEQAAQWFPTLARLRRRKRDLAGRGRVFAPSTRLRSAVESALPFALHASQREAIDLLERRMASGDQAHFLLQGDVGSGKTLVCLLGACAALEAGSQVAVLAPTEVLARQHLSTFRRLLSPLDVPVLYFASGVPREERASALSRLAHGRSAVAVGTHALLSDDVVFRDLGMVVFDEQHRFGVGQRQKLASKGSHPHVVAASATPIPRSLLLGAHGDMEVLEVRGKPGNRLPIRSRVVVPGKIPDMMSWLAAELSGGAKLFWVVPRVDESDEAASVEGSAEKLRQAFGADRVGILHGRMDGPEQNAAIEALRDGTIRALVSTTVVEVGVDVPDADLMVVEHPEFFGLAQLHQLRGRVGRGGGQGWCFLLPADEDKLERLRRFTATEDGFEIAEIDMEERGAGDLEGAVQSGGVLGRSGLLKEHVGLLDRWREGVDRILAGELPLTDAERERMEAWFAEGRLAEALTG
ncbi:MAG TPA: ATP-dependent DNA helicase RecG [Fibrobacteria bacterium]|nr:ATP-dependent DNA helicase RecG [Fibrobacteria bacterium]